MFDTACLRNWSSKPLSIFVKLASGDEDKVDKVKKIIEDNFNLSPRRIRKC